MRFSDILCICVQELCAVQNIESIDGVPKITDGGYESDPCTISSQAVKTEAVRKQACERIQRRHLLGDGAGKRQRENEKKSENV